MIDYKNRARLAVMVLIRMGSEIETNTFPYNLPNGNRAVRVSKSASRYVGLAGITKDTPLLSKEDLRLAWGEDK